MCESIAKFCIIIIVLKFKPKGAKARLEKENDQKKSQKKILKKKTKKAAIKEQIKDLKTKTKAKDEDCEIGQCMLDKNLGKPEIVD